MPYANAEKMREVQREGARRRRAAKRLAAVEAAVVDVAEDVTAEPRVAPIAVEVAPDDAPIVSVADLALAGDVLRHRQGAHEPDAEYRARLRSVFRAFLNVVE